MTATTHLHFICCSANAYNCEQSMITIYSVAWFSSSFISFLHCISTYIHYRRKIESDLLASVFPFFPFLLVHILFSQHELPCNKNPQFHFFHAIDLQCPKYVVLQREKETFFCFNYFEIKICHWIVCYSLNLRLNRFNCTVTE